MTNHLYRTLFGAALAATFIGAAIAQTTSDDPSRLPANKAMPGAEAMQPADQPTDKMKGQTDLNTPAMEKAPASTKTTAPDQSAKKTATAKPSKPATHHASKSTSQSTAALDPSERAFRDALKQCAKQQDQSQRDSCLDSAIEQFQRG